MIRRKAKWGLWIPEKEIFLDGFKFSSKRQARSIAKLTTYYVNIWTGVKSEVEVKRLV